MVLNTDNDANRVLRVPSLSSLCLRVLARYPGHIPLDVRLNYQDDSDVLDNVLGPAFWSVLVQVYDGLPLYLRTIVVPFSDPHVLSLQQIPQSPQFSLLTILDLPACPSLTDKSIVFIAGLHSLVALDASATSLSSYAIKVLSGTLLWIDNGPQRRGPWPLRILRLRFCNKVDDTVYPHLGKFPLLTVIDLRGTNCHPFKIRLEEFNSSDRKEFFHPAPLATAVDALSEKNLYTSPYLFKLIIDRLDRAKTPRKEDGEPRPHEFVAPNSESKSDTTSSRSALESTPSMFYSHSSSRSHSSSKYDLVNNYEAKTYYNWAHLEIAARTAGPHDSELALYRSPPAWQTLEAISLSLLRDLETRRSAKREIPTQLASINRTERIFQLSQSRIEALRRSASCSGMKASESTPKPQEAAFSNNPFRRHSSSVVVTKKKVLKPISAVEIPRLPSRLDVDSKSTPTPRDTQNSKLTPADFLSSHLPTSSSKRLRLSIGKTRKEEGSNCKSKGNTGFDWGTWKKK
ncbi:hypothetical protein H0H93_007280 [Arthromyces matolae]|nr:hypothetical protein H0H93_007280 [Arthromyces matolae]